MHRFCFLLLVSLCLVHASTAQEKARVYITDSASWEARASAGGLNGAFAASSAGGARPQTAEVIKTLAQRCPAVIANNHVDASDYVLELDHEGGKGVLAHKDKVVVFVRTTGDSIFSKSTLSVGGSVQDACAAITTHWTAHAAELRAPAMQAAALPATGASPAPAQAQSIPVAAGVAHLMLTSTPDHADITINGSFVGSTPSTIDLSPGDESITIEKKGFAPWTRQMKVTGGTISVHAELAP